MEKVLLSLAAGACLLVSCVSNPEGKKAETTDSVEATVSGSGNALTVDTAASSVVWTGRKVSGQHHGTVKIKTGSLTVDGGKLVGGNFVIDLNTIDNQDLEGEYKGKLEGHLKSADFFDVENHPEATFEITGVKDGAEAGVAVISGNLTLRGVTKNITFDAHVAEASDTSLRATADFNIAREDWGVNYAGQADDLISKEINLKITLVAGA
ncbi:YceI family protein [Parapedobacter sp. ISTM3]|uniref:Polyisoprenoid-binding protein YceI n=1 Tax=Parapedobacter luteus TaxID=623280 RepID=A0A1T5CGI9_9SPHI|nr:MULTISPECIES: YceI family protein [Parapedobacter]MBK1438920.1 YceI family protein [Parapedobacter sp. ISTM3]SKB58557.1 Polyisoprenoid-binding protein YceI [Parapedobacter luteus]